MKVHVIPTSDFPASKVNIDQLTRQIDAALATDGATQRIESVSVNTPVEGEVVLTFTTAITTGRFGRVVQPVIAAHDGSRRRREPVEVRSPDGSAFAIEVADDGTLTTRKVS